MRIQQNIIVKDLSTELQIILAVLQCKNSTLQYLLTQSVVNWDVFLKMVIRHRVWHQVYAAFTPLTHHIPILVYKKLTRLRQKDCMQILRMASAIRRLTRELEQHAICHCFIKGIVLNEYLYGGLITRPCKDIDIWVEPARYQHVIEILYTLGYQKKYPKYELNGYKEQYYLQNKHDIAFYHPARQIEIELHFRLGDFGIAFYSLSSAHFQSVNLFNLPIQTLEDHYHLLYLILHGTMHAWVRLRWLNDIALYIKSNKCSLPRIMHLAKHLNCEHMVLQALILVRDLLIVENAEMACLLAHPHQKAQALAQMCKQFLAEGYSPSEGRGIYSRNFFRHRVYLAKIALPGARMQAVLGDLFKIDNLFNYVTFPCRLRFMYYVLYPLWVIKYVIFRR